MKKSEMKNVPVGQVVKISVCSKNMMDGAVGKVTANFIEDTIYGKTRRIEINPIDETWFGLLVITTHGDYGSYSNDMISLEPIKH